MFFREMYFRFRANKKTFIFLLSQVTVYFVLLGTFFAFTQELHYGKDALEKTYANKSIFQLLDGYYDPDEFESFREQKDALTILKKYYHGLDNAQSFQYLAMFNQGLVVNDRENKLSNIQMREETKEKIVKSFQMNRQAHDFFSLSISEGRSFGIEDFYDNQDRIPVIVGSNFSESVSVGDLFEVVYYQNIVTLEVVGVLDKNSKVYFNGDAEYYLDDHFVIPYINYLEPQNDFQEWFQEIVYFAMINGYIATNKTETASENMMAELETIAQNSGFHNYLFIGSNPNTQPYRGLMNVMNQNYRLAVWLFITAFVLNALTICLQLFLILKRSYPAFAIHYLYGATLSNLIFRLCCEIGMVLLGAVALSYTIMKYTLQITDINMLIGILSVAVLFSLAISLFPVYKLRTTQLAFLLNDEGGDN